MDTGKIITIVVIVALSALVVFFGYQSYSLQQQVEDLQLSEESLTAEIEDLEEDIIDYKADLENKDLDIEEKERLLEEKEEMIREKQRKIDQLVKQNKISKSEAAELRSKVESLEYYIKKYQKEIEELKRELAVVSAERDSLKTRTNTLDTEVARTQDQLEEKEGIIKAGQILAAHAFKFYRKKNSGKQIDQSEFRPGQMDDFKVCWDITQNLVAEPGARVAYVQMIDPSGKVVSDNQGGTFKNYAGETVSYSATANFNFNKTATNICIDFPTPSGYEYGKGTHTVRVWCEGYDIGESKFTVK